MKPSPYTTQSPSWFSALLRHLRRHPAVACGLIVGLLLAFVLFVQSLYLLVAGGHQEIYRYALYGGLVAFATNALGALPALALRGIPQQIEDSMLGFAAGMMLAASAFSLAIPGIAAGKQMLGSAPAGAGIVVLGMALGVLLMIGLDRVIPHQHLASGTFGVAHERVSRIWLFVLAISLHNLPEGMAIGTSFANGDLSVGLPLTMAIALQDIPEGLAVALALRGAGLSAPRAVLVGVLSGIPEAIGALLGVGLSASLPLAYPVGLGLAAGAMLFAVSHEVIPETHRNGHQTFATIGLIAGFALMMTLDTTLG